jgi:hypothetical protein
MTSRNDRPQHELFTWPRSHGKGWVIRVTPRALKIKTLPSVTRVLGMTSRRDVDLAYVSEQRNAPSSGLDRGTNLVEFWRDVLSPCSERHDVMSRKKAYCVG